MSFSRLATALFFLALLVVATVLPPQSAYAQVSAGGGAAGYNIFSADGQGRPLGFVLVLAKDNILPDSIMAPKHFPRGAEYWYWQNESEAYPAAFLLVPSDSAKLPSDVVSDYDIFDHLAFDLSSPHAFPKLSTDPSADRSYVVHISDLNGKPLDSTPEAWFAFLNKGNGAQLAWARKDIGNSYLSASKDQGLLFVSAPLPAAGSIEVVPAR